MIVAQERTSAPFTGRGMPVEECGIAWPMWTLFYIIQGELQLTETRIVLQFPFRYAAHN